MKRILLTGGSGFIGKNLKEKLCRNYEIYAPDSRTLNLLNLNMVEQYLRNGHFDIVIHSANINSTKRSDISDYNLLEGNLRMFFNLKHCTNYYGNMYYFGSGAEYGMNHYIPKMKENYFGTYIPVEPYGFSKYIMSMECKNSENIFDLRLFGVYGRYEEWHRRFISNAICRVLKGMPITITQNVYFDYLWVDDLVEIVKWFIENEPKYKHYNICRGTSIDLYTLACKIKKNLKSDCDVIVSKAGFKPEYSGCNTRMLEEIGKIKFTEWDKTIQDLSDFYRDNIKLIDENKL